MVRREAASRDVTPRRILRLPAEGPGEALPAPEVHFQARPEEAGGKARPQGFPGIGWEKDLPGFRWAGFLSKYHIFCTLPLRNLFSQSCYAPLGENLVPEPAHEMEEQ